MNACRTAIAHSIREQVQAYQKSLFLVGHVIDGTVVQDEELRQSFLPSLSSGARPLSEVSTFTPTLQYLSDGDIERTEKERDKDLAKRRKRNTRGRRVALPDREPIRTYRTPAIGFPELDPATLALQAAANAPVSRRAAAAAASLTIANMVASENGTAFMPQTMTTNPTPAPQAPQKEKKAKGLFKAPTVPQSVLKPRAQVQAPTPSTALIDHSALPAPLDDDPPKVNPAPQVVYDRTAAGAVAGPGASSSGTGAQKPWTAKTAKELEKQAKEKEFIDGQHPNYIEGVWHCSNCGCPEDIAVGRRKGPLGDKSQCGACGKYWHRHRRPRPIEYNPDHGHHESLRRKEAEAKTPVSKKKGKKEKEVEKAGGEETPRGRNGAAGGVSRQSPALGVKKGEEDEDERALSPVSTVSSESEAPLAQKVKVNGASKKEKEEKEKEREKEREKEKEKAPAAPANGDSSNAAPATPVSPQKIGPPDWLVGAMHAMQKRYPNDKFDVILRKTSSSTPEWRIKCLDCPGKVCFHLSFSFLSI